MNTKHILPLVLTFFFLANIIEAEIPPESPASKGWWPEAKFGLFLHWGLYSVAAGEWKGERAKGNEHFMIHNRVPLKEYATLAQTFNPVKFDAEQWVLAARNAGMKYIVITSKHHEGFAMFQSPSSHYNIVETTPWAKDPMVPLAAACKKYGVVLCFYYSLGRDWEDPDVPTTWPVKGGRSNVVDYPDEDKKIFARYFERKVKPQIRELLTQYGPIGVLWFDTPELISAAESQELRKMIHELQPNCIINNRIGNNQGDFEVCEQKTGAPSKVTPWESCITMSHGWGYNRYDTQWKSPEVILRDLIQVVSRGGNLLVNIGPTGAGEIPAPGLERLAMIGRWMTLNGEGLYGAHPWRVAQENGDNTLTVKADSEKGVESGTLKDALNDTTSQATSPDFCFTAKGDYVYVFARSWHAAEFSVKALGRRQGKVVASVKWLGGINLVKWEQTEDALTITLDSEREALEIPIYTFKIGFAPN